MKLKYLEKGILQKEEELGKGWLAQVSYKSLNITNIDLSDFAGTFEKTIEIEQNHFLKLTINDAPFLRPIYNVMDSYPGMPIVEFQLGEIQVVVEW